MTKRLPDFSDVASLERVTGSDWLENRNLLAWATTKSRGILVKNIETGETRRIEMPGAGSPRFSPDGGKLLFVARQIYLCDIETLEPKKLTDFRGPVMEPLWSPDGTKILFASQQSGGGSAPVAMPFPYADAGRPDEAVVIEDFGYKFDGLGFIRPDGHMHLFIADAVTGEVRRLTGGTNCDWLHASWSPDSRRVACVGDYARSRAEALGYDLFLFDTDDAHFGEFKQISHNCCMVSYPNPLRPVFTPDGSAVLMGILNPAVDSANDETYPEVYLCRFPVDGGASEPVFEPDADCYQCVQFPYNSFSGWGMEKLQITPEGDAVLFVSGWQGSCVLYRLPIGLDSARHAEKLLCGKFACNGIGRIFNGKVLVSTCAPTVPETYSILNLSSGELTPVMQSAEDFIEEVRLSEQDDFFFDTEDGKGRVHGWVVPPLDMEPGKKYPVLLYIHGGPHPFYTYGLTLEHQAFAAKGIGVIRCNPRGSSGYGFEHQNLKYALDGTAMRDLIQFVREAAARYDWIDLDRVGVTGGSYGGYMTNELAVHPEAHGGLFKAYIAQRSTSNELISYASSDINGSSKGYDSFEDFMMDKLKTSQVSYAEKVDRPLLLLHGQDDLRCPMEHAHQFFIAVKDLHPDLPVRLVIYPHVNHDQPSNPVQSADYYREMTDWLEKYL